MPTGTPRLACSRHVAVTLCRPLAVALGIVLAAPAQNLRPIGPPAQANGTGCYDTVRQRYVFVDTAWRTWENAGQGWAERTANAPFEQFGDQVFAASHREVWALVEGATQQWLTTWAYDGASWRQLPAANRPAARIEASVAWDAGLQRLVLFGGADATTGQEYDETWSFDGAGWSLHASPVRPAARSRAAMAYDAARRRMVLFGGQGRSIGFLQDTWEWNGSTWSLQFPTIAPGARSFAAMAYDPSRARCVLYGGHAGGPSPASDTWEYDGISWVSRTTGAPAPTGRLRPSLAFDTSRGEVALFGGTSVSGGQESFERSRWLWNGTRWLQADSLGAAPGFRIGANLFAEPGFTGTILFGGALQNAIPNDTWRWNGSTWTALAVSGPSGRAHSATCTTPGGALLFGGAGGLQNIQYFGDTWSWNGTAWTAVSQAGGPSPRADTSMVWDAARGRAVLFGGYAGSAYGDTWTFDGVQWQQASPAVSPPARFGHGIAYDPSRARTVLFGGLDAQFQSRGDAWEWDGATWTQLPLANAPVGLGYCSLLYDPSRQCLVLIGCPAPFGGPAAAWTLQANTWVPLPLAPGRIFGYGTQMAVATGGRGVLLAITGQLHQLSPAAAAAGEFGAACGNDPPGLSASTWPVPGAPFGLDCTGNDAGTMVAFVGGYTLGSTPIGPCTLLVGGGSTTATALVTANAGGFAHLPLNLPPLPSLLGLSMYFQAASLRSPSAFGFVLSRGLAVTIGD